MHPFPVSEKKARQLEEKIKALGLHDSDFTESFVRAQGAGGQNVNKVSSCVMLRHKPSGLAVKCQKERSQALNRYLAKRALVEKIEERMLGRESAKRHAAEKIRRQKKRRSRRSKEKMLDAKRVHGQKKLWRRAVQPGDSS